MIDGHIHYANSLETKRLNQIITEYNLEGIALMCIPKGGTLPVEEDAFAFQTQCNVPVYIFGGIDRDIYQLPDMDMREALGREIERLTQMGCTGIKMLEGKPNVRKQYPIPDFDSPVWDTYWENAERLQTPILMHVNDPEEFWDAAKVSDYARQAGWFYGETYINNEEQYRQMQNVLSKYPNLRILFPHFFFLSAQLDRLSGILDKHPNVFIDVTPGSELFYNLSEQIEDARAFFEKYASRICYGTDIGARSVIKKELVPLSIEESRARIHLVTRFLEAREAYILEPDGYYLKEQKPTLMQPLRLSDDILRKIYGDNFRRFINCQT